MKKQPRTEEEERLEKEKRDRLERKRQMVRFGRERREESDKRAQSVEGEEGRGGGVRKMQREMKLQQLEEKLGEWRDSEGRRVKRRLMGDTGGDAGGGEGSEEGEEEETLDWGSDVKSEVFREDWRGGAGGRGGEGRGLCESFAVVDEETVARWRKTLKNEPLNVEILYRCSRAMLKSGKEKEIREAHSLYTTSLAEARNQQRGGQRTHARTHAYIHTGVQEEDIHLVYGKVLFEIATGGYSLKSARQWYLARKGTRALNFENFSQVALPPLVV
jgi:hypothetical protein